MHLTFGHKTRVIAPIMTTSKMTTFWNVLRPKGLKRKPHTLLQISTIIILLLSYSYYLIILRSFLQVVHNWYQIKKLLPHNNTQAIHPNDHLMSLALDDQNVLILCDEIATG